jgi:hypothetical protein
MKNKARLLFKQPGLWGLPRPLRVTPALPFHSAYKNVSKIPAVAWFLLALHVRRLKVKNDSGKSDIIQKR